MTTQQKRIINILFDGGIIAKTTSVKWTAYDKHMNPVVRFHAKGLKKIDPLLKNIRGKTIRTISIKAVISLRKSSWVKQQYRSRLESARQKRICKPCTFELITYKKTT